MKEDETNGDGITGVIPDFFHDVIAYLIPGYTVIFILFINVYVATHKAPFKFDFDVAAFFFITVTAYVIGRFLQHVGYLGIHRKKFPFFGKNIETVTPKCGLLFDKKDQSYTKAFKDNLKDKIKEWLDDQNGSGLLKECEENNKDDYFNLIRFYLLERFPLVALYEKKQNATIVLMRSLAVVFFLNIIVYSIMLFILEPKGDIVFSCTSLIWVFGNLIFSLVFYSRFQLDKKYHAMYIFETFIAMNHFFRKKSVSNDADNNV